MDDFTIKTGQYIQENKIIDDHFYINYISQVRRKKRAIDCFGPNWCILFLSKVEGKGLLIRSGKKYLSIDSDKMVFCPPYTLFETLLPEGTKFNIVTITSDWPLEKKFLNPVMMDLENILTMPKTREQVLNLLNKFKKGEELPQQIVISAPAEKLKKCIEQHYTRNSKIYEMAQDLKISREVLTRSFKKAYNITPIDYRHRLRLFEGLTLINSGMPIIEVTKNVGYSDAKQFITQFKKHFNATPRIFSPFLKAREGAV